MSERVFILSLMLLTVAAHIGLLACRGWLIGELRREQNKMKTKWEDFKQDQEQWRKDFEERHPSWMGNKKRTA